LRGCLRGVPPAQGLARRGDRCHAIRCSDNLATCPLTLLFTDLEGDDESRAVGDASADPCGGDREVRPEPRQTAHARGPDPGSARALTSRR